MTAVVLRGDARALPLPDESVDLIVTSPPYFGLRSYTDTRDCPKCRDMIADGRDPRQAWPDYQAHWDRDHKPLPYDGQIGSEATPAEWVAALVECTREWMRVLKPSGSMFVNLGDKYATRSSSQRGATGKAGLFNDAIPDRINPPNRTGMPDKCLLGLPWRYALACTDQLGLILRRDIIWSKPNGLPESVTDRCRSSHEYVFHLVKQPRYYAAVDEIREPHTGNSHSGGIAPKTIRGLPVGARASYGASSADFNPLGKLPGSVWSIPSQPLTVPPGLGVDHFAAFPVELPRRIIAGWSPPGVCTACGQGRRPVTMADGESYYHAAGKTGRDPKLRADTSPEGGGNTRTINGTVPSFPLRTRTITGYTCACPDATAPTRPALVVDPFGGTGTTALVASVLGRTGISFDLSHDYSRLARWRTADPGERCRVIGAPKPPPVADGQDALFAL